ncbi:MAG: HD domain-containing protein [Candidatus Aenigmatarchaeota archaeon]
MTSEDFKNKISTFQYYHPADLKIIEKALYIAEKIYQGIKWFDSKPYLNHCLRSAINLAELKLPKELIIANILKSSLENRNINEKELEKEFGSEVISLIKGLNKISNYRYKKKDPIQAENLRNLILVISQDIRVIIIKLACLLDEVRNLNYFSQNEQKIIILETEDIYAPLALRLGISKWSMELADLAFKYSDPEKYNWIVQETKKRVDRGEEYLEKIKTILEKELKKGGVKVIKIEYRIKTPSSIYKKLKRKNFNFDQIYDLLALRIIVETVEECYYVLGVIHSLFKPLTEEFNDYIAFPKPNGYQSLHTTCIGPEEKFIEFQIRTEAMNIYNEEGVAAYFAYVDLKQTKNYQKKRIFFAEKKEIELIKKMRDWQKNVNEIFEGKIYVLTPKEDVIELRSGSTPLDFAYKIHSYLGNHFAGARVNNKLVPIDYKLQNGDVVEIIVNKQKKPSPDWLKIVKSSYAKKEIKSQLKKINHVFSYKFNFNLKIIAQDRIGLLRDITNIISSRNVNISESKSKTNKGLAYLYFKIQTNNKEEIDNLKELIKIKIKEVLKIE